MFQVMRATAARLLTRISVLTGSRPRHRRSRHTPSMFTVESWSGHAGLRPGYSGVGRHRMSSIVLASLAGDHARHVRHVSLAPLQEVA